MWTLSQRWYGDRLDETYRPTPIDELQGLLTAAGLDDDFWRLRP